MRTVLIAEQICDRTGESVLSTAFWVRVGKGRLRLLLLLVCSLDANLRRK